MGTLDEIPMTPLHMAARRENNFDGRFAVVELFLDNGAAVNGRTCEKGPTPLGYAAMRKDDDAVEMARLLLRRGADPNAGIANAASCGCNEVLEFLLGVEGADVDSIPSDSEATALYYAVGTWHLKECDGNEDRQKAVKRMMERTQLLLRHGANPNAATVSEESKGWRPIHQAIEAPVQVLELLLSAKGIDVDAATASGRTPLMEAVKSGSVNVVRILLRHGADPNKCLDVWTDADMMPQPGSGGWTPLIYVVNKANADEDADLMGIVKALLAAPGIDVHRRLTISYGTYNALKVAVTKDNKKIAALLRGAGLRPGELGSGDIAKGY